MTFQQGIVPSLATVQSILQKADAPSSSSGTAPKRRPTAVPLYGQLSSDLITPSAAYLKVTAAENADYSFLFESAATEQVGRYSFVGAGPRRVMTSGPGFGEEVDPLPALEEELGRHVIAEVEGLKLPPLAGGSIGYVGYDCVRYFEPKTARPMKDVLGIPESLFMLFDTVVAFDRYFGVIKVITYLQVPGSYWTAGEEERKKALEEEYAAARARINRLIGVLNEPDIPVPEQVDVTTGQGYKSNIGQAGYESHVSRLKEHIVKGDIFQAVPSQRVAYPTKLHPFNVYRHLRTVNPSPYLFYISCRDFFIVGASPELLVKSEPSPLPSTSSNSTTPSKRAGQRIITHPIAGTVPRGATPEQDAQLAASLQASLKDRAEHVMLVDLARNDVNRVSDPLTVRVDRLMTVEKFSHVQHLTSQVSGCLRPGMTRFDAFRSIFPAGTVSGAPKVKAMELIAELEGEKRGVYAGAVGYFGYGSLNTETGEETDGAMDTCIALRTMMLKDGVAYLQAGGGIVFDSDPTEEWIETMNKLGSNITALTTAEQMYYEQQTQGK